VNSTTVPDMGKKNRGKQAVAAAKKQERPFVSVCTPTFNRRPFIKTMIACFAHQTYPRDRMEWIIIDDGTDKIGDLVEGIPQVKYYAYDKKMTLGKKRNLMHEKSCGEILVYMDDDDYYQPERVSHAVMRLQSNQQWLCAGSSELHVYFKHLGHIVQFGPYGPKHATAGTFAFKRKLLENHQYDEDACLAEERAFLKEYTVPFVQLDTRKTILVFSHEHNTFDKRKLLHKPNPKFVQDSRFKVRDFVKERDLERFFLEEIDETLKGYAPGDPSMKPDVLAQTARIEEERRKIAEEHEAAQGIQPAIVVRGADGEPRSLSARETMEMMQHMQTELQSKTEEVAALRGRVSSLEAALERSEETREKEKTWT